MASQADLHGHFKTVNIWRTKKLKTSCSFIVVVCLSEIKTRQTIFEHNIVSL